MNNEAHDRGWIDDNSKGIALMKLLTANVKARLRLISTRMDVHLQRSWTQLHLWPRFRWSSEQIRLTIQEQPIGVVVIVCLYEHLTDRVNMRRPCKRLSHARLVSFPGAKPHYSCNFSLASFRSIEEPMLSVFIPYIVKAFPQFGRLSFEMCSSQ